MPEAILTILKFCFLGLLYLFLARVVRAVYRELTPDRVVPVSSNGSRFGRGRGRKADQPARPYRLKMIDPDTAQTFPLSEEVTIGRAPGCSVPLADDTYVSQLHARIYIRDGKPFVEDLGSTNGTFLNRDRLSRTMPLHRGDKLQIGQTVLEIVQ
ncbi:MAG TPA: FHA domain-containing protein [Acidimicrobiia bacterium]|nr:FHA domain-containing protein [Acidimicrobiia bacterium]